jgi:hypothetical protein
MLDAIHKKILIYSIIHVHVRVSYMYMALPHSNYMCTYCGLQLTWKNKKAKISDLRTDHYTTSTP